MKISPRSCRLKIAYAVATPTRSATSAPLARAAIAPCHGSQLEKMWFMMPVPLVSVMNCERKPISPRAGMRNSSRTRPLPLFTIFVITPLRSPTCAMTMPW